MIEHPIYSSTPNRRPRRSCAALCWVALEYINHRTCPGMSWAGHFTPV